MVSAVSTRCKRKTHVNGLKKCQSMRSSARFHAAQEKNAREWTEKRSLCAH